MVVAWRNVRCYRSQHIKRRFAAHLLFHYDIRLYLVDRHMSGAFNHCLASLLPAQLGELAVYEQFLYLHPVGCVMDSSGTKTVAQAEHGIVFFKNINYPVEML